MPQIQINQAYRVDLVEFEHGWGSRIDKTLYFDNEEEAKKYVKDYNEKYNSQEEVPDWYMIADYIGPIKRKI